MPMFPLATRETQYDTFVEEILNPFWQRREELLFTGLHGVPLQALSFTSPSHQKVLLIVSGFMESYLKYQETAYDFFQRGYDVFMYDHRGQGFSGRMLDDPSSVHVEDFKNYVADLLLFWNEKLLSSPNYKQRYVLGHSMGGAITTLFLAEQPAKLNAAVLSSPMIEIVSPLPMPLVKRILQTSENSSGLQQKKIFGFSFITSLQIKKTIGSEVRNQHIKKLYEIYPDANQVAPTFHWLHEALSAKILITEKLNSIIAPVFLLQAGKDVLVANPAQQKFIEQLANVPQRQQKPEIKLYPGAYHEILADHDIIREEAINDIDHFLNRYL